MPRYFWQQESMAVSELQRSPSRPVTLADPLK